MSETTPDGLDVAAIAEWRALLADGRCLCSSANTNWRALDDLLAALDEANACIDRYEAENQKFLRDVMDEQERREAAESARDAAEGVVREVRARAERLADAIQAVQEDRGWKHNEGCEGEPDCFACIELDLRRLAPVTTDATEGEA